MHPTHTTGNNPLRKHPAPAWRSLLPALALGAFAALPFAPSPARAASATVDGITWSYDLVGDVAMITGASPAEGKLSMPASLDGHPVTSVGYRAFATCDDLTSMAIPEGVASIADRAFQYCSCLEEISLPPGMANIGEMAFQYCESLATVALPQTLETLGTNAFLHCSALQKLYAPVTWAGTGKLSSAGLGSGCAVVYAEPGKETVRFDPNGGTCETLFRAYPLGQPYGWLPEAQPSSARFEFAGWFTATNGGTRILATGTPSLEGLRTLYAHWTPLEQKVTFDPNGGICGTTNATYAFGETYSPLPEASREHYAFDGWWTGGSNVTETTTVTTNSTLTLYAHWTLTEQVVTFDANGGTASTNRCVYALGGKYKPLPSATREGYYFDGWFTSSTGGDRVSAATAVTSGATRTLYAHWTLVEQIVTFDANGGACDTADHTYTVGAAYGWLPVPTRAHAVFAGWFTDDGECIDETTLVSVQHTQTLHAGWWCYSLYTATVTFFSPTNFNGHMEIPDLLNGYPVTGIGIRAFYGCTNLTSVMIPDSVTRIGEEAFYGCNALYDTNTLPGVCLVDGWAVGWTNSLSGALDLTGIRGIADSGFRDCRGLRSVTIPDSVTSIGSSAFARCDGLTSVTIPDSVTSIGDSAFYYCSGLTSVTIPDSVTSIGRSAFAGCNGLTSVTIPDSVTSIGSSAFARCNGLTSMTIPDSVTSIGDYAFSGCSALTNVTIPDSVTNIGKQAFSACSSLESFSVADGNPAYKSMSGLLLTKDGKGLIAGVNGDVVIPDSVMNIWNSAFSGCSGLTSVTIPDSVRLIGNEVFYDCSSLTSVMISQCVLSTGFTQVFGSAYANIQNVALSHGVSDIGDSAFYYCDRLRNVTIPNSVTNIGDWAFMYCSGLTNVTIPNSVTSIGYYAFGYCRSLTNLTIPNSVTSIESCAFSGCRGLKNATILGNITNQWELGEYTPFHACNNLETVVFGDKMRNIGNCMFYGCSNLLTVTISNSVTKIGYRAFSDCRSLTSVTIPGSVTDIWGCAFDNCSGLTNVIILGNITNDWEWSTSPFAHCTNIAEFVLGNKMTKIGNWMFYDCSGLTDITIPRNITRIGSAVFSGCNGLTSVTIPDSVTRIERNAFSGCNGLKTLYVPIKWKGTSNLANAGVPSGCTIIYYEREGTAGTPVPVPFAWLEENAPAILAAHTNDYESAAVAPAANGRPVWECYVADISPADATAQFTATLSYENGQWLPKPLPDRSPSRAYDIQGTDRLAPDAVWGPTNSSTRFFRLRVRLP